MADPVSSLGCCPICQALEPLRVAGPLLVCAACAAKGYGPICAPRTHDWHPRGDGIWICYRCAGRLDSVPIEGDIAPKEQPAKDIWNV